MRDHPITPVSEPMQYRAIGLVRGIYCPEGPDHFTRGVLRDEKGLEIECVVLGRLITLMRRHISMEKPHLWVVYPRCKEEKHLHLQLAGVWEPSTLKLENNVQDLEKKEWEEQDHISEGDNYFSIRGELIFTKPEEDQLIIKIRQKPRKTNKKLLPFKIRINGRIPRENLQSFISLDVRRVGENLTMENYEIIGAMPDQNIKKNRGTSKKY